MNAIRLLVCFVLIGMAVAACGETSDKKMEVIDHTAPSPAPLENRSEIIRINGESPYDFYKHFFFRDTESCERIWYTTTLSDSLLVGKDELGRDIKASVAIMILPSNVFYARYDETSVTKYTSGGYEGVPRLNRTMKGTWELKKELIVFKGLGYASGLSVNGRKAMYLRIERDFEKSGFAGQSTFVHRMHSTHVGIPELDRCRPMNGLVR